MDMSTSIARRGLEDGAHTADLPGVRLGCGQLGMAHGRRGVAQGTGWVQEIGEGFGFDRI